MRVVVLGAGVVGITTAYFLARDGHEVTVLEARQGPGLGTSYANGGQLSVSHPEPWSSPAVPGMILKALVDRDGPLGLPRAGHPALWPWGARFLRNCTSARHHRHMQRIARLALYSRRQLAALRAHTGIRFHHGMPGILHVFTSPADFRRGRALAARRRALGIRQEILDHGGCLEVEPALAHAPAGLVGGIYAPCDEVGDAHAFTRGLAALCAAQGVELRYGEPVVSLDHGGGRVRAAVTAAARITADCFVVALGCAAAAMLRPLGMAVPVYPVKGYSATLASPGAGGAPMVSMIHEARRIVVSRLGGRIRVAGGADLAAHDDTVDERRARAVLSPVGRLFPALADLDGAELWAGLRPMTPSGVPILGPAGMENLYLNVGHGSLGWTLACGSARMVADGVGGRPTTLDAADYAL